ncbi:NAD(P)-dependent dehydrogenase, short-chain alcohol dehydrogenase family [Zhouia amylolytica]|uniref:NAD(P)-dependent dehydrogenase, short-chain alcohol dehydrogenase family n=1 Tax=Zhouia amylolytica TaxID=376730 RepID=A0A1I6QQA8_9FLAO|nr:SDR family oxidoreductase [Zhouia amylolytica]MCQ0112024.1 SDR family oxidoreductase [Zhouia amylolytica]SFS54681.1 NAD(P)-dependent dehydrogenase, short-chain alcohol dehydrogenase family [Zhouia amylolytica]
MSTLNEKVAVVTGGNSGIGYASALKLKEQGAKVIITGRSPERVKAAATELGVEGFVADVSDLSAIDALVVSVEANYGKVDILFVNAGIFQPAGIGQITEGQFDHQMDINFKGAVFTIEKFLPILNDGASIINLSSINAYTGMPNTAIYAASKAALNSYTRTAASELAVRKIRVNAVNPGPVSTPIFQKTGMAEEQLNGFANAIQNRIPLKRFGAPEDVANLVAFLASDEASFITGGEYNIDGGINVNPILS